VILVSNVSIPLITDNTSANDPASSDIAGGTFTFSTVLGIDPGGDPDADAVIERVVGTETFTLTADADGTALNDGANALVSGAGADGVTAQSGALGSLSLINSSATFNIYDNTAANTEIIAGVRTIGVGSDLGSLSVDGDLGKFNDPNSHGDDALVIGGSLTGTVSVGGRLAGDVLVTGSINRIAVSGIIDGDFAGDNPAIISAGTGITEIEAVGDIRADIKVTGTGNIGIIETTDGSIKGIEGGGVSTTINTADGSIGYVLADVTAPGAGVVASEANDTVNGGDILANNITAAGTSGSIGTIKADGNIDSNIDAATTITLIESLDGDIGIVGSGSPQDIDAVGAITSVFADLDSSGTSNINTDISGSSIASVIAGDNIGNLANVTIAAVGTVAPAAGDIGRVEAKSGYIGTGGFTVTITTQNTAGNPALYGDITDGVYADVDTTLGNGNNTVVRGGIIGTIQANDIGTIKADGNIDANIDAFTSGTDTGAITLVESVDGSVGIIGGLVAEDMDATAGIGSVLADSDQSSHNVGNPTDINTNIAGSSIGPVTAGGSIGNLAAITISTPGTGTTIGAVTAKGGSIGAAGFGITISAADGIGAITATGAGAASTIDALLINGNNDSDTVGTGIASITANGTINFDTITTDDGFDILAAGPGIGPITSLGGSILDRAGGVAATITSGGGQGDIKAVTPGQAIGTFAFPIAINLDGDIDLVSAPGAVAGGVTAGPPPIDARTVGTHVTINAGHVVPGTPLITVVNGPITYTIDATGPFGDAALFFDIGTAGSGATPDVGLSSITGTTLATTLNFTATGGAKIDLIGIDVDPSFNPGRFTAPFAPDAFGQIDVGTILVKGNLGRTDGAGSPAPGFIDVDDGQAPDSLGRVTYIQIDGKIVAGSKIQVESIGLIGVADVLPVGTIVLPAGTPVVPTELTDYIFVVPAGLTKGWFFTTADGATALGPAGFDDPRDGIPFAHAVYITARADSDAIVRIDIDGNNSEGDNYIIGDVEILSPAEALALGYTGILGGALGFEATTGVASLTETGPGIGFVEIEGPLGALTLHSLGGPSTPGDGLGSVSSGFWIGVTGVDDVVVPASFIAAPNTGNLLNLFPTVAATYTSIINPGLNGTFSTGNDDFILWGGAANLGPVLVEDYPVKDVRGPDVGNLNFEVAASGSASSITVKRTNLTEGQGDPLDMESIIVGDDFLGPLSVPDGRLTGSIYTGAGKVISLGLDFNANNAFTITGAVVTPGANQDDLFETIPETDVLGLITLPTGFVAGTIAFDATISSSQVRGPSPLGAGKIGTSASSVTTISVGNDVLDGETFFNSRMSGPNGVFANITITGSLINYRIDSIRDSILGTGAVIGITGDMNNSDIVALTDIEQVNIGRDMIASTIVGGGNLTGVSITRDMTGTPNPSGDESLIQGKDIGPITIGRDMINESSIVAKRDLTSLTITRDMGNDTPSAVGADVTVTRNIGAVSIGDDMTNSEIIATSGNIASVVIGPTWCTIPAVSNMINSSLTAGLNIGNIDINGDLDNSDIIATAGNIGNIRVGDDITGEHGDVNIKASGGTIGNITVADSILAPVNIEALHVGTITVGFDPYHNPNDVDGGGINGLHILSRDSIGDIIVVHGNITDSSFETVVSYFGDIGDIAVYHGNISDDVTFEADGSIGNIYVGVLPGTDGLLGTDDDVVLLNDVSINEIRDDVTIIARLGGIGNITVADDMEDDVVIGASVGGIGQIRVYDDLQDDVSIWTAYGSGGDLAGLYVGGEIEDDVDIDIDGDINELTQSTVIGSVTGAVLVGGSILGDVSIQGASIGAGGDALVVGINGIGNINPEGDTITIRARGTNGNIGDITVRDRIGSPSGGGDVEITSADGSIGNIVAGGIYAAGKGQVSIVARTAIGDIVTLDDAVGGIANTSVRVTSATGTIGDIIAHGSITDLDFLDFDGSIGDIVSLNGYVELEDFTFGGSIGDIYASEDIDIDNITVEAGSIGLDGVMSSTLTAVTDTSINKADTTLAFNSSLGTWTVKDGLNRERPDGAPADGLFSQAGSIFFEGVFVGGTPTTSSPNLGSVGDFNAFTGVFIGDIGGEPVRIGGNLGNVTAGTVIDIENTIVHGNVGQITGYGSALIGDDDSVYIENVNIGGNVAGIKGIAGDVEIYETYVVGNVGDINALIDIDIDIVVNGNISDVYAQEGDIVGGSTIVAGGNIGDFTLGTGVRAGNFIYDGVTIIAKGTIGEVEARILGYSSGNIPGEHDEIVEDSDGILDGVNDILLPDNDHVFDFSNDYLVIADSTGDNVIELSPVIQAYIHQVQPDLLADGKIDSQEALNIIAFGGEQMPDISDPNYTYTLQTIFQDIFKEVEIIDVDDVVDVPDVVTVSDGNIDSNVLVIIAEGNDPVGARAIGRVVSTVFTSSDLYVDATRGGIGMISSGGILGLTDEYIASIEAGITGTYGGEGGGDTLANAIIRARTSIDTIKGDDGIMNLDIQVTGGITVDPTKPLDQMITTTGGVGLGRDLNGDGDFIDAGEILPGIISGGDIEIKVVTGGSIGYTVTTGGSINNNYDAFGNIGSIIAKDNITGTYTAAMGFIGNAISGTGQARFVSGGVLAASGDIDADFKTGLGMGNLSAPLGNVSGSLTTGGVLKGENPQFVIESSGADDDDFEVNLSSAALKLYTTYTTLDTDSGTAANPESITVNSQTIAVTGSSSALRVKVGQAFGYFMDVTITGSGSLVFDSTGDVGVMTVEPGANVSVSSINVDGDFGGFININKNAKVANITATEDIGQVIGYGVVQNITAGEDIGEVKSLFKDVKNVFAGEDIERIFAFNNVQNIVAQDRIGEIIAGKNVKIVHASEIGTISAANVSKVFALGDIDLISASGNITDVSSGGDMEVIAGKNATRIAASSGKVSVGGKASKVGYNLEIVTPPKSPVVCVDL
jgi:hypothetical protein